MSTQTENHFNLIHLWQLLEIFLRKFGLFPLEIKPYENILKSEKCEVK